MPEPKPEEMNRVLRLHLATNFEQLCGLIKGHSIKDARNIYRLPALASRMLTEIRDNRRDQEWCYIIGRRYLDVMRFYISQMTDKKFYELRHGKEMRFVAGMLQGLESELKARYNSMETYQDEQIRNMDLAPQPSSSSSGESARNYIRPQQANEAAVKTVFSKSEIAPVELFNAMMKRTNILVVDIRPPEEFAESKVNMQYGGTIINIPHDLIVPGLSANTLGMQLNQMSREIWNRRDTYEAIVLMDWETDSTNYLGSRLERLRNIILDWDFNRKYQQPPVILSGGYKEFSEWYPSEVTNSLAYVSQTNSDIDDLLTVDDVDYPILGSGAGNAKKLGASNFGDVQGRVERDFGDLEAPPARASKSEGELPKDYYISDVGPSPFRSISEESLPKDYYAVDTLDPIPAIDLPQEPQPGPSSAPQFKKPHAVASTAPQYEPQPGPSTAPEYMDTQPGPSTANEPGLSTAVLKSLIDEDMADMLKKARASKPPRRSPSPRDRDIRDLFMRPQQSEGDSSFRPARPSRPDRPPAVNRNYKPISPVPRIAMGLTGIRNHKNNCYISSIMQALKVLPPIKALFVESDQYLNHVNKEPPCIILHFATALKVLWEGTLRRQRTYFPQALIERIYNLNKTYANGNHEDAFEFFIFLFNNVSDDCAYDLPRPKFMTESQRSWFSQLQGRSSFLIDMMYYQLKNTRHCWKCQKPSYIFDQDSTLMLSIPEEPRLCNLHYMLADYMRENLVSDFSCASCKSSATIVNRKEIIQDPEVLVIVLKRYAVNPDGTCTKIEVPVSFPVNGLEFGRSVYKLYSIVQHSGSVTQGHYFTSALLDERENFWVMFNDEKFAIHKHPIDENEDVQVASVGFFYVRQGENKPESM